MNGTRLKLLIRGRGMSQQKVANAIGMSLSQFGAKLNGDSDFKLSQVRKMIDVLSMTDEEVNTIFMA